MPSTDPRVDAYIEKSQDFAKPILNHIRALVHAACPEATETMKWSFPHFDYKGEMMCSMAAFKAHCAFGFWKQSLLENDAFPAEKTAMGSFGRLTSVKDLPSDKVMKKLIKDAMKLNDAGIKVQRAPVSKDKKELVVPDILLESLAKNDAAAETFNSFPYSKKKDYVVWITEAKSDATRDKRLATTIEWLAEGKSRMWKYEKC
ncbi:MAG TPA: YdeI/OmpD-associated family protein [Pyrinomonadaceae bacterium]|nr:YdeI/OmpD-associated family protein [Pyrinomonadaceae bacterium]